MDEYFNSQWQGEEIEQGLSVAIGMSQTPGIVKGTGRGGFEPCIPGEDYGYPVLTGSGAPDMETAASFSQFYIDQSATVPPYVYVNVGYDNVNGYQWRSLAGLSAIDPTAQGSFRLNPKFGETKGWFSTAMGISCEATADYSHAVGYSSRATGKQASAEGYYTNANGESSHAEGSATLTQGKASHAEGASTAAYGANSHTEGLGTQAGSENQHVQGKYNVKDSDKKYAHIVGNGASSDERSNAHTLDWDGNAWFAGKVFVGGTGADDPNAVELGTGSGTGGGVSDYNELANKPIMPLPYKPNNTNYVGVSEPYIVDFAELEDGVLYHALNQNTSALVIIKSGTSQTYETWTPLRNIPSQLDVGGANMLWYAQRFYDSYGRMSLAYLHTLSSYVIMNFYYADDTATEYSTVKVNNVDLGAHSNDLISFGNTMMYKPTGMYNPAPKYYVDNAVREGIENLKFPVPNWDNNDFTSAGYIAGRTHYEEPDPDNTSDTLTWDGVIGDKFAMPMDESGEILLVRVSETILSPADFVGGSFVLIQGGETLSAPISADMLLEEMGAIMVGVNGMPVIATFPSGMEEAGLLSGTYFISMANSGYASQLTCANPVFGSKIVHPLPEKYIPEMSSVTLISPNGTRYKVTVSDTGTLSAAEVSE